MDEMNYDKMGKEALRTECRNREISYGKLDNAGMRAALRADDASHTEFANGDGVTRDEFEATPEELSKQAVRQDVQQAAGKIELTDKDREQIAAEAASRQQPAPAKSAPRSRRASNAGLKIEANREERNGVKRPSAGGKCRKIWDYLDANPKSTAKDVREHAVAVKWDPVTTMVQYYRWRKFQGITGRQA